MVNEQAGIVGDALPFIIGLHLETWGGESMLIVSNTFTKNIIMCLSGMFINLHSE